MTKPSLLILDDEQEVLNALNRVLRKDFDLYLFSDPFQALDFYRDKPVPLVVSDMRMPHMDGAKFLARIAEINEKSKRFLLTGHADINTTVAAVNEGKISHFFSKPWDNDDLIKQLKAAAAVYNKSATSKQLFKQNIKENEKLVSLNASMKQMVRQSQKKIHHYSLSQTKNFTRFKKTFSAFIDIFADTIALHTQDKTRHNYRIAAQARHIATQLKCEKLATFEIYVAGLLYETGKLYLPQSLLQQTYEQLSHQEQSTYQYFYQNCEPLLGSVDELTAIIEIIKHIPQPYDTKEYDQEDDRSETGIDAATPKQAPPLGSKILSIVIFFDNLLIDRQTSLTISYLEAIRKITLLSGEIFDPQLVACFIKFIEDMQVIEDDNGDSNVNETIEYVINTSQLTEGMQISQNLILEGHSILLTQGTVIKKKHIEKLRDIEEEQHTQLIIFISRDSDIRSSHSDCA